MSRLGRSLASGLRVAGLLTRAGGANLAEHWALGLFSLAAAFAIWFAIQDVENPRTTDIVPAGQQGIPVRTENQPDGMIVDDLPGVKVKVEAREEDLPNLLPSDFDARVNVNGIPEGATEPRPVQVEARRPGVKVLSVEPANVEVRMLRAAQKEFRVAVHQEGQLPAGFQLAEDPVVDPAFVAVIGRPDLVDTVKTVEIDVNLAGVRSDAFEHEGELVARTESGNPVTVGLSQRRAKASFKITQLFSQRRLPVFTALTGVQAPGYRVTGVSWDPAVITVTGPKSVIDSLPDTLTTERLDITGARSEFSQTKQIERPPNVSVDHQSVVVRVRIEPIACDPSQETSLCPSVTWSVGPTFDRPPPGLELTGGPYSVQVTISGAPAQLAALKPGDIRASVSLAGARAGTSSYPVVVTAAPGLTVESADAFLTVTVAPVSIP
jgi:YbbR domain-containing protein